MGIEGLLLNFLEIETRCKRRRTELRLFETGCRTENAEMNVTTSNRMTECQQLSTRKVWINNEYRLACKTDTLPYIS